MPVDGSAEMAKGPKLDAAAKDKYGQGMAQLGRGMLRYVALAGALTIEVIPALFEVICASIKAHTLRASSRSCCDLMVAEYLLLNKVIENVVPGCSG